ncbi:MAG TPA: Na-translocating system protein MpsC family protein, partial [Solirubrobacterales bacterium]|nr:Na-translocating system protein MpsC family protein [Solirubrobacterales bacterium]
LSIAGKEIPRGGQALVELSNAMVALHREYFGRGPGAAKSFVNDEMVVCVLSDIYTAVERTLIRAGQAEHVRRTRSLHQEALEDEYKARVEAIMDRPVEAFLSVVHVDPDVAIEVFLLGEATPA